MAAAPIFRGRVTAEGELKPFDHERAQRRAYLRTLAGQDVEIVIRKKQSQRSLEQNKYIHFAATLASEHSGYTLAEVKLLWMGECWGWKTVGGHEVPAKPHTSDMTVEEATYFIDWMPPWSLEHMGVPIPPPERVAA